MVDLIYWIPRMLFLICVFLLLVGCCNVFGSTCAYSYTGGSIDQYAPKDVDAFIQITVGDGDESSTVNATASTNDVKRTFAESKVEVIRVNTNAKYHSLYVSGASSTVDGNETKEALICHEKDPIYCIPASGGTLDLSNKMIKNSWWGYRIVDSNYTGYKQSEDINLFSHQKPTYPSNGETYHAILDQGSLVYTTRTNDTNSLDSERETKTLIRFGVQLGSGAPSGTYLGTVKFTAIATP